LKQHTPQTTDATKDRAEGGEGARPKLFDTNTLPKTVEQQTLATLQQILAIAWELKEHVENGYSLTPAGAPHACWSQVLEDNLSRSRKRIAAAGPFDQGLVDTVAGMVSDSRAELDSLPAIPFLHDTTTKNVIVTAQGEFSGIVDVDDLCFGDPRYVVALTLASVGAFGGSTHYVDAWMNFAHYRRDRIFQLYVALFLIDFMSEEGQTFNNNRPALSADRQARLSNAFHAHLRLLKNH
jgi:hypothetical protein